MSGAGAPRTDAGNLSEATICPIGCDGAPQRVFVLAGQPVFRCGACGLLFLGAPAIEQSSQLERTVFEDALQHVRQANYDVILAELAALGRRPGDRLLDVGCSSGWFLERARAAGYQCRGVEPDSFFFEHAKARVQPPTEIVNGYFDRDLPESWRGFDVVSFNDVFEHVPNPDATLAACRARLAPGGLLVLALPSASGFVFVLSTWLHRVGFSAPLERMFQVHYPYPHLFYFDGRSMSVMAERYGFTVVSRRRARSFSLRGAMRRAQMDRAEGILGQVRNLLTGIVLSLFAGLEYLLPADNEIFILKVNRA